MKRKITILLIFITIALTSFVGIIYVNNETNKLNSLPEINLSYQEGWRSIDYNLTNYIKLIEIYSEIYNSLTTDNSYTKKVEQLSYQYISTERKDEKIKIYQKLKEINDSLDTLNSNDELYIKEKTLTKTSKESINMLIDSYNEKVKQYNSIVTSPVIKIFFHNKYNEKSLLK